MIDKDKMRSLLYDEYCAELSASLSTVTQGEIDAAILKIVETVKSENMIWIIGNGGSSATASHFAADLMRPIKSNCRVRASSLSENSIRVTAIGNDFGFENIFSYQLENLAKPGDLLVILSASGKSLNLLNAIHCANSLEIGTFSMVGFDGGFLKDSTDLCLHFRTKNGAYEIAEDCHSLTSHYLAKSVRQSLEFL